MTRRAGCPSSSPSRAALISRTALISRMAGSPRLTIAMRRKANGLIGLLTEGGADIVAGAPGHRPGAALAGRGRGGVLQVQHHLIRDDGRVDAHHRVAADGAG